ncbi:uncharacterized protein TRAVEDRAFT_52997 [Trametes versicolor FP-101664 SS1]|uniref:uncharacterized protein n=1 Tax=Trametes versicolor (strain FP-101664) TaxID=717944 RepID=UPI000462453A|nr:uncharacterized protein TRAVEDRAFT_52997 [Trametes versicolor FP-101664 SS1]EIW52554.1 hypothetical protein TRAVEDRAFT_52997 [Trametes versicolor FP-101664 SS1]
MPSVPPAPQLPQQALQEIFSYPDQNRPLDPTNKFSNALRLEFFGSKIALAVYTNAMTTTGFQTFMERTANAYQWRHQVNGPYPPNVNPQSAEEAHRIFYTYTGAICVHYDSEGFARVQNWFADLKSAGL